MNRLVVSKLLAFAVGISCIYLAYTHNKSSVYEANGSIYGTYWKLVSTEYISNSLQALITNELKRIDGIASHYKAESELSIINSLPINEKIKISKDLYLVLSYAENLYSISGGLYDVTIGSMVADGGFGPKKVTKELYDAKSLRRFEIHDDLYITKYNQFMFDLSSIAKGYAVDRLFQILINSNRQNFLLDIGGELIASGTKHGSPWRIGIQNPTIDQNQSIIELISNQFLAVATSGEYRNFSKNKNGDVSSHTYNPLTEKSIISNVLSVTTTSKNSSMEADAWATALNVMGPEDGLPLANEHDISVMYIINNDDEIYFLESNSWRH